MDFHKKSQSRLILPWDLMIIGKYVLCRIKLLLRLLATGDNASHRAGLRRLRRRAPRGHRHTNSLFTQKSIIICSALCGAKITINYEIAKKNRRKVLKNRNIYRFSFEIQNNYVILQRI